MGNICSKSENKPDNFAQPGRVLGTSSSAQQSSGSARVPPKITTSTQGRTLGGQQGSTSPEDARGAAAKAAEVGDSVRGCRYDP